MESFEFSLNISPFELFKNLNPENGWILLDSSYYQSDYGKYSIIAPLPEFIFSFDGDKISIIQNDKIEILTAEPIKHLKKLFYELKLKCNLNEFVCPSFCCGFAGYLSYDFGLRIEKVNSNKNSNYDLPEIFFGYFTSTLVFNHETKKYTAYSLENVKEFLHRLFDLYSIQKFSDANFTSELNSNFTKEEYIRKVQKAKEYIEAGEIYQVNLSQQFSCKIDNHPIQVYSRLRELNPAPFSALICVDKNRWILSSSPELFIDLKNKRAITKPIKGTIRRGNSPEEDEKMMMQLLNSEKDSAELLMIVDLERNDLGKVSKPGSVKVNSLKKIESYASVHHLVSEIESELEDDKDIFDLIEAMFPGGSITGAPKKRSMEIIDELEKCKRGVYTGSIGFIDLSGNAKFNVAIRTIVYDSGKLFLNLGGGIVYDSEPEKEFEETLHKGKKIFDSFLNSR